MSELPDRSVEYLFTSQQINNKKGYDKIQYDYQAAVCLLLFRPEE